MTRGWPDDDLPQGPGHDDNLPELPVEWAGFTVPDDASELEAEATALRRERRVVARRTRAERLFKTTRWERHGLSGPLVVLVLAVVMLFGSLVFLMLPAGPGAPYVRTLAHPSASPGTVGGLVPDLALPVGSDSSVRLRTVRPALLLLVPASCGCTALIGDLVDQTRESRVKVLIVSGAGEAALPADAPHNRVMSAADPDGRLTGTYGGGAKPTAVLVAADGVVTQVIRDAQPGQALREELTGIASG